MLLEDNEIKDISDKLGGNTIQEYTFYTEASHTKFQSINVQINGRAAGSPYIQQLSRFANKQDISICGCSWLSKEETASFALQNNAVYISEFLFDTIKANPDKNAKLNYHDDSKTILIKDLTEENIVGYKIQINQILKEKHDLVVAGVFRTGFDINSERYLPLFDSTKTYEEKKLLLIEAENASTNSLDGCIIGATDNFIEYLQDGIFFNYKKGITTLAKSYDFQNYSKTKRLLDSLSKKTYYQELETSECKYYSSYSFENSMVDYLSSEFNELIGILRPLFLVIGLVFGIFSGLLLANLIANSISYQKKEIGILRAIGARGVDVFKTYMSETFIIATINFVLSTTASLCILNIFIASRFEQKTGGIDVLRFNYITPLIIFVITYLTAFLSTYVLVYLTARKKPIDAINNK